MVILSCWALRALQGAILILVPKMMLQEQLSALQLALPLSLGTFLFLYCSGRWGKLLDARFTQNKSLIWVIRWVLLGFFVSQLSFLLLLTSSYFQGVSLVMALCLSRILHGVFCSAIIPHAQFLLSHHDQNGEKLVWSSIAINIGRLTAPLLTFVPLDIDYFSLWFIIAVTLGALIIVWLTPSERAIDPVILSQPVMPSLDDENKNDTLFSFFSNPFLLTICVTAVLILLYSSQLQFSLGPLLFAQFSNVALASKLLFVASGSALLSLFLLYRPLSRFPRIFLLVITTFLIVGSCLFVLQHNLLLSVAFISVALSMAPAWYSALAIHASTNNKARTSATISQGHTLGNSLGGLMGGALLIFGAQALLVSFILLMCLILLAWLIVYRQENDDNKVFCMTES